jgi:hypothetical protein
MSRIVVVIQELELGNVILPVLRNAEKSAARLREPLTREGNGRTKFKPDRMPGKPPKR